MVMAGAAGALGVLAGPAAADPAGPTDYRTDVIEIEPAAAGIEVRIIGGDSFVRLRAEPGVEVLVMGYRGEPYLRFAADGTVWQNERSPSRWLNDDRFGEAEIPPEAEPDAEPEWLAVASDGSYAWHDHRTHWMNPARPIGAEPGDTILEAVVPLVVDGRPTSISVRSTLLPGPSIVATAIGAVAALAAAAVAVSTARRRRRLLPVVVVVWSGGALGLGWWAYRSVPAETGPSRLLWLLPLVAVAAACFTAVVDRSDRSTTARNALLPQATLALSGLELAIWGWFRRDALVRALIPSDAPASVDRAVIIGALIVGLAAVAGAGLAIVTAPRTAPRPAP